MVKPAKPPPVCCHGARIPRVSEHATDSGLAVSKPEVRTKYFAGEKASDATDRRSKTDSSGLNVGTLHPRVLDIDVCTRNGSYRVTAQFESDHALLSVSGPNTADLVY